MGPDQLVFMIPIIGTIAIVALIFGIRYFTNRERMAMIEKGLNPVIPKKRSDTFNTLRWGLLLIGVGIGLFLAYLLTETVLRGPEPEAVYFGLIGVFGGLGLVVSYLINKKREERQDE